MAESDLVHRDTTRAIVGAFYEVHRTLGFGFLESAYASALEGELTEAGHAVSREHAVRIMYKGRELGFHRMDLLVDRLVVVEVKATPPLAPATKRQLINYLRATNLEVGLLLHFGTAPRFLRVFSPNRTPPPDGSIGHAEMALFDGRGDL